MAKLPTMTVRVVHAPAATSPEQRRLSKRRARRIREMKARQRAAAKLGTTPMLMQVVRAALAGCGNPDCPD